MASTSVKNYILYYKNKLDRCKDDEDMILETIHKLAKPPTVTAEIIQDTGILKCLHKLCRRKGKVADTAFPLFNKWKLLMTIAMNEKEKAATSPPEEMPNHLQGDQQASRSSHPAQEKDPSIHPPHRSRDSHPDRGIKRKDTFPPVAEQKRPTHHPHRERDPKHPIPQKDHTDTKPPNPPPDAKSHQPPTDAKYGNPSHHRSSDSDSDRGSRHQPAKRNYLVDGKRDQEESHYMADSAYGNPRNPKRDLEGTSHYLDDSGYGSSIKIKRDQREAVSHYKGDSAYGNPRNPKRDFETTSQYVAESVYGNPRNPKQDLEATSHWGSETESRHQQSKKDYLADSVHGNPRNPKKDEAMSHWGKDFKSRKDPETDPTHQKDYLADSTHGNPRNPKKDEALSHWGSSYKSRKDAPGTDPTAKRDCLADRNPKKDHKAMTFREYKSRMEAEADSSHGSSKYPSVLRDLFPIMEGDAVDGAGESNRDSDSRYPPPTKDYFAAEADTTCPGSRSSEHNGVTNSQDSNHHMDIDSLSNPNLCIETSQAERLAGSDTDSEAATPTKRAKTLEPYYIEMREGMFRAVKNHAGPFAGAGGLRYCELIHRDIIKGNSIYKRDREKFEEPKKFEPSFPFFPSSPKDTSSDGEKNHSKNGPAEQKTERSGRPRDEKPGGMYDLKRKSASPCKDRKATRPDSTSDHKLKMKKDSLSPSHLSKPLNNVEAHQSNCDRNKKLLDSPETTAMQYISSKKDRRAVYSGKKAAQDISSLKSNCLRVLRKNLDYLRCPMKVPYETLHPILETLNPSQLSKIEEHNRYLMAYTNSLWKQHYNRDCRGQMIPKSDKEVAWKEEYNRAQEQQRKKLKNLTASINASTSKAKPDRQAKVVESHHDFGRRGTRTSEVPISSSKSANVPSVSPAIGSRLSSSPNPKAGSSSVPRTVLPIVSKPKDIKHSSAHKPVKKVTAPLMSKVKKSMAIVYRQK